MKNRKIVVTGLLATLGFGAVFGGVCLATGDCPNRASTPAATGQASTPKKEIRWHTSLDEAMKEGAANDKLIFVDFHATWCPPCKMMDQQTFSDPAFAEAAQDWVMLKIDTDQDVATAMKYGVSGLPTLAVLQANGEAVAGVSGFHSAKELLQFMQAAKIQAGRE